MNPSEAFQAVSLALAAQGFTPTTAEIEALASAHRSLLATMDRLYEVTEPDVVPQLAMLTEKAEGHRPPH